MTPLRIIPDVEQSAIIDDASRLHRSIRKTGEPATLDAIGLLRHGTVGGKAVVSLALTLPDGTVVLGQTTLALWRTAVRALEASPVAAEEVIDP